LIVQKVASDLHHYKEKVKTLESNLHHRKQPNLIFDKKVENRKEINESSRQFGIENRLNSVYKSFTRKLNIQEVGKKSRTKSG